MKLWIALLSRDGVTRPRTIALSSAPDLVRQFIDDLQTNRLLEDDADDVICDPAFPAEADRMKACVTEQMRLDAVLSFSAVDPTCSEADPTDSPAPEPAPTGPRSAGPGSAGREGA